MKNKEVESEKQEEVQEGGSAERESVLPRLQLPRGRTAVTKSVYPQFRASVLDSESTDGGGSDAQFSWYE